MHIYTKDEVCMTIYSELSIDSKLKKVPKCLSFTSYKSQCLKCNHHIAGAHVNIHTKYEVSMIMYVGRRANQ